MDNVLKCPCGRCIEQKVKLGMFVYEHEDGELCELLHSGDGLKAIQESINNNFKNFERYFLFKQDVENLVFKETSIIPKINRLCPIIKEITKMYGNEQKLVEYFQEFSDYILNSLIAVQNIIMVFGSQGEYLMKKIGVKIQTTYIKSTNPIDLGLNIKSDYDIKMQEIVKNKESRTEAMKQGVNDLINKKRQPTVVKEEW